MDSISRQQVPFAAEDRFILIGIRDALEMCPTHEDGQILQIAIDLSEQISGNVTPVLDLRGLRNLYDDVSEFIEGLSSEKTHLLIEPEDEDASVDMQLKQKGFKVLCVRSPKHKTAPLNLHKFRGSRDEFGSLEVLASDLYITTISPKIKRLLSLRNLHEIESFLEKEISEGWSIDFFSDRLHYLSDNSLSKDEAVRMAKTFKLLLPSIARELNPILGSPLSLRRRTNEQDFDFGDLQVQSIISNHIKASYFHAFINQLHTHSLMVEFAMCLNGDSVTCVPYHSLAAYNVELPNQEQLIIARPGVVAKRTAMIFSEEIEHLSHLLNDQSTKEKDIQKFLEGHPNFLRGLNYKNIYPQLVLERDRQGTLIPDFILEPLDGDWCDILDLKLPKQKIIVGRNDRQTLASGIHEVAAQLREYAAYFEQERYRNFVKQKYGLNVYKPRLIALVGRDLEQMTTDELRRTLTAYPDLTILTFDKLLQHARNHILL